ncbi:MAG: OmpH family outer membrane protein [Heliobacteriaceae bacterium]|jgi:Skp family chaperone for outer membrane proteins|nr:OmpH family outer membrane protein [Heliobacteriaceae bacterium]
MKKLLLALVLLAGTQAFAAGVGYIDYQKVQQNYAFAKSAVKDVDNQALALQQYMLEKEKQYKALDTPLKKQNFEEVTAKEFKVKEDALMKLKTQKEEQVYNKIQAATKQVLVEQKLDAIVDYRVIFVGGIDITDLVISKLKTGQF